jgi:hypothetical protein
MLSREGRAEAARGMRGLREGGAPNRGVGRWETEGAPRFKWNLTLGSETAQNSREGARFLSRFLCPPAGSEPLVGQEGPPALGEITFWTARAAVDHFSWHLSLAVFFLFV